MLMNESHLQKLVQDFCLPRVTEVKQLSRLAQKSVGSSC